MSEIKEEPAKTIRRVIKTAREAQNLEFNVDEAIKQIMTQVNAHYIHRDSVKDAIPATQNLSGEKMMFREYHQRAGFNKAIYHIKKKLGIE